MHFLCLLSMRERGYITCIKQCKLIIVIPTHVVHREERKEENRRCNIVLHCSLAR